MMPLTMKTAATPEARAIIVHDRLLLPALVRYQEALLQRVAFNVEYISRYGVSTMPQDIPTATGVTSEH